MIKGLFKLNPTRIRIFVVFTLFVVGLLFSSTVTTKKVEETFMNIKEAGELSPSNCPNLLIKKDGKIILKNTRKAEVPGVNPIVFDNIGEYDEFMEWMRSQGIRCPILYLEYTNNTQGENGYRVLRNVNDTGSILPLLDATYDRLPNQQLLSDAGYTPNNFPGFDPQNQYQGVETPLDKLHTIQQEYNISDNPMDPNWGGPHVTQKNIERGKYDMNTAKNRKSAMQLALEARQA